MISDKIYVSNSQEQGYIRAKLYKPGEIDNTPCAFACFIIDDKWNEKSLLELKDKTGCVSLIGILTHSNKNCLETLNTVDGIVKCQSDEVQAVVDLLGSDVAKGMFTLDAFDIKRLLETEGILHFIQVCPIKIESTREETLKIVVEKVLEKLPKGIYFNSMVLDFHAQNILIEELRYISETIEPAIKVNDSELSYQSTDTEDLDCIGLRVIFAL
ncbi:hypothetical protein [Psychrobacter sanguinis]|uniref:hypothetical protein n=1 Tax=Psychrobacter sanguinis TaxID=861445 RepID=UPI001918BE8D|nr:hypothetical protein [Psychrobacter sanguinis]UEC25031.1 hypothetical protein LK453_10905 [Psychrobacter sanguinis]